MLKSKRAIAVALAALGLTAAADIPTDLQHNSIGMTTADAALELQAEPVEYQIPSFGEAEEADLSLPTLVDRLSDYGDIEFDEEMRCLASAVYNEARGESIEGQLAVAQVVLNRAADPRWPKTICGVVYQRYQFSFTFDNEPDFPKVHTQPWRQAKAIAIVAATESWDDLTDSAVYYHADYVRPNWRGAFTQTANIGQHLFYR